MKIQMDSHPNSQVEQVCNLKFKWAPIQFDIKVSDSDYVLRN